MKKAPSPHPTLKNFILGKEKELPFRSTYSIERVVLLIITLKVSRGPPNSPPEEGWPRRAGVVDI